MSSGSTSTGLYPIFALVTDLRPREPWGRYESRFTQCMQSMCTANLRRKHG